MKKVAMVAIGQAPRSDVTPIIEKIMDGRATIVQAGALDGLTKQEIEEQLAPVEGEYILTTRLRNGESVVMSREKLKPLLQAKLYEMEDQGIETIFILCTGIFPGLTTHKAYLVEPDLILPSVIKALVGKRRLGGIVPLPAQKFTSGGKYQPLGLAPVFADADPYAATDETLYAAANFLKDKSDIILLDCMGFTEEKRAIVEEASGLPVILSNALMCKLLSEMV